jgi:glutamine synthetase adenylyltransferase
MLMHHADAQADGFLAVTDARLRPFTRMLPLSAW